MNSHWLLESSLSAFQTRFLQTNVALTDDEDYKWWVPLNCHDQITRFDSTTPDVWMPNTGDPVTLTSSSSGWFVCNKQQTGYYRVNYHESNWDLLIQQLRSDVESIHETNRAQLVDDAMNLARSGRLFVY